MNQKSTEKQILSLKDQILLEEICQLVDGFENKQIAIASLLKMSIALGCKYKGDDKTCIGCPLTSYTCREIHERSNMILSDMCEKEGDE